VGEAVKATAFSMHGAQDLLVGFASLGGSLMSKSCIMYGKPLTECVFSHSVASDHSCFVKVMANIE
jgi:hypothetical protein